MKSLNHWLIAIVVVTGGVVAGAGIVSAAPDAGALSKVKFPVAELGNCRSEGECRTYCDSPDNITACVSFAEKNGLIGAEEAARAREFRDVLRGEGPGGCKDQKSCESYCDDMDNASECLSFAEKHNLISADELAAARKVTAALAAGAKLPGGCSNKDSCDSYCKSPNHIDECFAFAEKAGLMGPEELEEARKVIPLMKRGETPGGCTSKEQCESYCAAEDHAIECVNFAEKAGFMTREEAEMVRKTGGKGPGGCRSKESCDAFCENDENAEQCLAFAKQYNLIPEAQLREMEEGMKRLREGIKDAPPEVVACLEENLGAGVVSKIETGTFTPTRKSGDAMRKCFDRMREEGMDRLTEGLEQLPQEARACVEEKLGDDYAERLQSGALSGQDIMSYFTSCMSEFRPEGFPRE